MSPEVTYRSFARLAFAPLLAVLLLATGPAAFARSAPDSFADLAEKLLPAVVNIATTTKITDANRGDPDLEELFRQFFDKQRRGQGQGQGQGGDQNGDNGDGSQNGDNSGADAPPREVTSLGSGFIIDPTGYIVTNNHVIEGAEEITVRMQDNVEYKARLIGHDPKTDLALLKIDAPKPLPFVEWGDSDKSRIGDWVIAIGNPFGLDQTLTTGVISALNREIESVTRRPIQGVIQSDAAINPGNSGGPLLDSAGRLIGVNAAIYSPSGASAGIGFAIPVDTVNRIVPELIRSGKLLRPGLGIQIAEEQIAERLGVTGVLIIDVARASGAAKAGLRPTKRDRNGQILLGDVITAVDGKKVESPNELYLALEKYKIGDLVNLSLLRDGKPAQVKVALEAIQ
jgi:Do/DeqQ family serine protease